MTHEVYLRFRVGDPGGVDSNIGGLAQLAQERCVLAQMLIRDDEECHAAAIQALLDDSIDLLEPVSRDANVNLAQSEVALQREILAHIEVLHRLLGSSRATPLTESEAVALENFAWGAAEAARTFTPEDERNLWNDQEHPMPTASRLLAKRGV